MLCPHCKVEFHDTGSEVKLNDGPAVTLALRKEHQEKTSMAFGLATPESGMQRQEPVDVSAEQRLAIFDMWSLHERFCPNPKCQKLILNLVCRRIDFPSVEQGRIIMDTIVWPKYISSRPPCPEEVPNGVSEDYNEACLVLD